MANNDLNTNPLYNNIAGAAEDVKAAYTGLPTFQSNMQASVVGSDPGLNSALGGYTDKVAELFAHDNQIAQNWSTSQVPSTIQPEGFMEDPYKKAMASSALYKQKGEETANALNLYEKRKNYLGDLVTKAVEIYKAGIEGKKIDYEAAKTQFSNAIDLMNAETSRINANTSASAFNEGKTLKERAKNEALSQIEERAAQGASLGQLFDEFASSGAVEMKDVVETYKKTNYYKKPPEESSDRLARAWESASQGLGHTDILGNLSAAERAVIQPKTAVVAQTNLVIDRMRELAGNKDPNFVNNFSTGQFGLLRGVDKTFNNDQVLRQIIMRLTAKDRQEIFGSAFTEQEQKIAKSWLVGDKDMTNVMWSKLLAATLSNKAQVDSYLLGRSSPEELQTYWDKQKQLQMALGGFGGNDTSDRPSIDEAMEEN